MLKKTLIQALSGDRRHTDKLCREYHRIALAYLSTKIKSGHLVAEILYKNLEDFAWDCIADLFENPDEGLPQIAEYFDDFNIEQAKESLIFSQSRRLVFSKVNEGIYRNYKRFDSSLSKIIRNLKRTIEKERVNGAYYNATTGNIEFDFNTMANPLIPEELLEIKLGIDTSSIKNSVDAVERLSSILRENPEYAARYPLVGFALLLRKAFAYQLSAEEGEDHSLNKKMLYRNRELKSFLKEVLERKKPELHETYVASEKMPEQQFSKYLKVTELILTSDYIEEQKPETYYDHFEQVFPGLTQEEYRNDHRTVLEYIVKQVRSDLLHLLKKEMENSADLIGGMDIN